MNKQRNSKSKNSQRSNLPKNKLVPKPTTETIPVPDLSKPPPPFVRFTVPPPIIIRPLDCKIAQKSPVLSTPIPVPFWKLDAKNQHFSYNRCYIEYVQKFKESDFVDLMSLAFAVSEDTLLNCLKPELLYQFKFTISVWTKLVRKLKSLPSLSVTQQIHLQLLTCSKFTHHLAQFTIEHIQNCIDCVFQAIERIEQSSGEFVAKCMNTHNICLSEISIRKIPFDPAIKLSTAHWHLKVLK
jgi:hypothetical protein